MDIHRTTKDAIECYNKGENAKYISYDSFAVVLTKYALTHRMKLYNKVKSLKY